MTNGLLARWARAKEQTKNRNSPVIHDLGGRAQAIFPPPPPVSSFEIKNFPNNCAHIGDAPGILQGPAMTLLIIVRNAMLCEPYHIKFEA
jgi:hypothetical protein